jgi:hypothetical protein
MEQIHKIKETFSNAIYKGRCGSNYGNTKCTSGNYCSKRGWCGNTKAHRTDAQTEYNGDNLTYESSSPANNLTDSTSVLNYQMGELTKNYDSIDELDGNLETNTRKLNLLTQQTNELNKIAYVFKYITIISISLLILMICIFVLNFDHISGPSAVARSKASAFFKRLKVKKPKRII